MAETQSINRRPFDPFIHSVKEQTTNNNTISPVPSSDRKRKAAEEPEVAINSNNQKSKKSKPSRVNVNSPMTLSQIASLDANAPMATANNPSASTANERYRNILIDAVETRKGFFLELVDGNDRDVLRMLR